MSLVPVLAVMAGIYFVLAVGWRVNEELCYWFKDFSTADRDRCHRSSIESLALAAIAGVFCVLIMAGRWILNAI